MSGYELYLREVISMIEKIELSTTSKTFDDFVNDVNLFDAALMRIHFIGETLRSLPYSFKKNFKKIR